MGFPLRRGSLDRLSVIWVKNSAVLLLMPIDGSYVSAAAGYYDILVTDCIPWVANMAGI